MSDNDLLVVGEIITFRFRQYYMRVHDEKHLVLPHVSRQKARVLHGDIEEIEVDGHPRTPGVCVRVWAAIHL